ncbi:MAG: adenylate/guanylate cyclase domain-containing protein [Candidatus Aureabacteria bacterium]|nr:adenylate/guanylate cyclase domain-containing protein [Candidatus Auribacterota bacterium]
MKAAAPSRVSLMLTRFLNPLLIVVIVLASFMLLSAYFVETDQFIYASAAQRGIDNRISLIYVLASLAVFGAPQPQPDHRDRAIRAALAMCRALAEFNAEQGEDGQPELAVGMGVHSGLVLAGNIGTANKIEYTMIGDPVNVAQRLEEIIIEKGTPLICSGATLGPYKQRYPHEPLGIVQVRGRTDTIDIYSLMPAIRRPQQSNGAA